MNRVVRITTDDIETAKEAVLELLINGIPFYSSPCVGKTYSVGIYGAKAGTFFAVGFMKQLTGDFNVIEASGPIIDDTPIPDDLHGAENT